MRTLHLLAAFAGLTLCAADARADRPAPNDVQKIESDDDGEIRLQVANAETFSVGSDAFPVAIDVDRFRALCAAPCKTYLKPDIYRLALSKDGGDVSASQEVSIPAGPTTVRAHYVSNDGLRTAGWVLAIVGPLVGLGIAAYGSFGHQSAAGCASTNTCEHPSDAEVGLEIGGGSALAIGSFVGAWFWMIHRRDEARFEVLDAHVSLAPALWRTRGVEGAASRNVPGLSLQATW